MNAIRGDEADRAYTPTHCRVEALHLYVRLAGVGSGTGAMLVFQSLLMQKNGDSRCSEAMRLGRAPVKSHIRYGSLRDFPHIVRFWVVLCLKQAKVSVYFPSMPLTIDQSASQLTD